MEYKEPININEIYMSIKDRIPFEPEVALILGSGLGDFANEIEDSVTLPYHEIKGFPVSTVTGHAGQFVFGYVGKKKVVAMQGRVHYYEGYTMEQVVLPIRLMHMMGAEDLLLTNAAGGVNYNFKPGDLMIICDHITSFVPSPLIGKNNEDLGERFPDMSKVYNEDLIKLLTSIGEKLEIELKKGVYLQTTGPNYETPAEVNMYRMLGADAVGMSTACEAMAANHMKMRIAGISCITNFASGMSDKPLNHEEVKETANKIASDFKSLVKKFIEAI